MMLTPIRYTHPQAPQILTESLHQTGFAVLRDAPVPPDLIAQVYRDWAAFFADDAKHHYTFDPAQQSGYFPFQSEQAKGYTVPDLKEFFHVYPWIDLPAGMGDATWQLLTQLTQLATELLTWIDQQSPESLRHQFTMPLGEMIDGSQETLLRPLHYPPIPGAIAPGAIRAAAHEDINLITLLPAATAAGLELLDRQGQWSTVPGTPGDIVVNVGDMLQLASHGYYPSATHRVINPRGADTQTSRYSLPLFLHPRREVILAGTTTARQYLLERLHELGLLSTTDNP